MRDCKKIFILVAQVGPIRVYNHPMQPLMPTPESIERDQKIIDLSLQGLPVAQIAPQVGLSSRQVYRRREKEELRARIEEAQRAIIAQNINAVVSTISDLTQGYQGNECLNKKEEIEKAHGFRMIERLGESMGILPSHTQSIFIANIYNDNRQEVPDAVINLIQAHAQSFPDDPIEAEIMDKE